MYSIPVIHHLEHQSLSGKRHERILRVCNPHNRWITVWIKRHVVELQTVVKSHHAYLGLLWVGKVVQALLDALHSL